MGVRLILSGFLVYAMATQLVAGERERLILRVSPAVSFAPANLLVSASIEANPENRSVLVVAESSEFYRSSEIQLDGDRAPRTSTFEFRNLPAGVYDVKATLVGPGDRERAMARLQVRVVRSGADGR